MHRIILIASAFALMLLVGAACGDGSTDSFTPKPGDGSGGTTGTGGKDGTGGTGGIAGMGGKDGTGGTGGIAGMGGTGGMGGMGKGADCTPGFYKNHMALWDDVLGNCGEDNGEIHSNCGPYPDVERACCEGEDCGDLLASLKNRMPRGVGEAIRNGAKAELDACFGQDEPCENEDGDKDEY